MRLSAKNRILISVVVLSVSLVVWVVLLFNPGQIMTVEHCHVSDSGLSASSMSMLLDMNPISTQLAGWGLMVIAMMLPKLTFPIQDIFAGSLKRYRLPLSMLFISGYLAIWMIVGIVMIMIILGLHLLMPGSYIPALVVGFIATLWQFSPIKQRCLNRGHDHWILPAFGWPAYRGALHFGIIHGVWCVGARWVIMLFPMLLPKGHNLAMICVTFIMLSEHLEHPKVPCWRLDFRTKLFRIAATQIQLRLKPTARNV